MMGYKVGDEVLVKAVINDICVGELHPYEVKAVDNPRCGDTARVIYVREEDVFPASDMTAEEVWEIARKIVVSASKGGITIEDYENVFGNTGCDEIFATMTPQEAKAIIEAWESEKAIKVSDIVMNEGLRCVVTRVVQDRIYTVSEIGTTPAYCGERIKKLKKIGHHEGIEGLLKQIGGDEQCQ